MAIATVPVADRLTFDWQPSTEPGYRWALTITESRPRSERSTEYRVDAGPATPGVLTFLFAKSEAETGPRSDEVYQTEVGPGFWSCSCPGSACRRHGIACRHVLAVRELLASRMALAGSPGNRNAEACAV